MLGTRDPLSTNMALSEADGNHADFGYVDLGLPSGTMWATCNIGAAKPEALGDMYAYGETKRVNLWLQSRKQKKISLRSSAPSASSAFKYIPCTIRSKL